MMPAKDRIRSIGQISNFAGDIEQARAAGEQRLRRHATSST
jgi:hypothetical protein